MQFLDGQLARPPREGGGAAAGEEGDRDADALGEPGAQPVADVELLHLSRFARVDDLSVGPDTVDVRDDEADVGGLRHAGRIVAHTALTRESRPAIRRGPAPSRRSDRDSRREVCRQRSSPTRWRWWSPSAECRSGYPR